MGKSSSDKREFGRRRTAALADIDTAVLDIFTIFVPGGLEFGKESHSINTFYEEGTDVGEPLLALNVRGIAILSYHRYLCLCTQEPGI